MKRSRKVVLFFPAFASTEATAPLGLLAVATLLLRAGFAVTLIDSTITPHLKAKILEEVDDALCLGISLVTGPMIRETAEIARAVKTRQPDLPIILGGWHPSLLPQQTLEAPFIDIVVKGQGEEALLEVVERLKNEDALDGVRGVGFKRHGQPIWNLDRPLKRLVEMPPKAYHLADFDAYARLCGRRWGMYTSSLACPFDCSYCTNGGVYGRQWNALPAEQVVEETFDLTTRYRLELLWIVDDNFLVDIERALKIAEGLVRVGARFRWSVQATTNLTARLSLEELRLLRRAGLHQFQQGVDSASPKILKLMHKTFQDFDDIRVTAERCLQAGIKPSFNIIFGYPGEGPKERQETIRFIMEMCRRYPGVEFWTNIFTPYPGSPIMGHAREHGIETPNSFEGWAEYFPRYTVLPWLKGREHARVQTMREYLRIAFDRRPVTKYEVNPAVRKLQHALSRPARWRLNHDFYALPLEIWLNQKLKKFCPVAKPVVDAKLLEARPQASPA